MRATSATAPRPKGRSAPITALVVAYNEADTLDRCLASLWFCQEIVVVDLGSTDGSLRIAEQFGTAVISHPWVPIGELARAVGVERAQCDWVLITDPDEEVSPQLAHDLQQMVEAGHGQVGVVSVPCRNYVRGRALRGTVWGGTGTRKPLLVHKQRVELVTKVHSGFFTLVDGYSVQVMPLARDNWLNHYWMRSWKDFLAKHLRYIRLEGEARHLRGEAFRWRRLLKAVPYRFYECYISANGYRDGPRGLALSVFWGWYHFMSLVSLRRYARSAAGT